MDDEQIPERDTVSSSGTLRARHLLLIALAAVVVGTALYYSFFRHGAGPRPKPEGVTQVPEGSRAVTLYFADPNDEALVTETRLVAIGSEFNDQVGQVIRALLAGPEQGGISTIAAGTRLLDVFYDSEAATLYLDFTSELIAGHPGGTSAEYFTVAAIVRTVSQNFPEVKAVQFLVEGLQVGTIAGHIDAYRPFLVSDWR
jgi:spore germination protein GerM